MGIDEGLVERGGRRDSRLEGVVRADAARFLTIR